MPNKEKYAIVCSTEEEAMECREKGLYTIKEYSLYSCDFEYSMWLKLNGKAVITYAEARAKGLLGEHYQDTISTLSIDSENGEELKTIRSIADDGVVALENNNTKKVYDTIRYLESKLIKHLTPPEATEDGDEEIRCDKCWKAISSDHTMLSGPNGHICMQCEFKKPEVIRHWYRDGDTIEAEIDGCLWYGMLMGGFIKNPKLVSTEDTVVLERKTLEDMIEKRSKKDNEYADTSIGLFVKDLETLLHNK